MNRVRQESCWPNSSQELLLQASLLKDEKAFQAWSQWKSTVDLEKIDIGSYRLLPLLYRNLSAHNVNDAWLASLKKVYQQTKLQNQLRFHQIQSLIKFFQEHNIEIFLLKGLALTQLYYRDLGLRPMQDFDVLISADQAKKGIELLIKWGWTSFISVPINKFNENYFNMTHAHAFKHEMGVQELDLHWHVLAECCHREADDDFKKKPDLILLDDTSAYALNATQQLFHVCIHGLKWNRLPSFRWIADAIMILDNSKDKIDWHLLSVQAEKYRLSLRLRDALNYLIINFSAPIPSQVITELNNRVIEKLEYKEHQFIVKAPRIHFIGSIKTTWYQHLRNTQLIRWSKRCKKPPYYLQFFWNVDLLLKLPFFLWMKLRQKFQRVY